MLHALWSIQELLFQPPLCWTVFTTRLSSAGEWRLVCFYTAPTNISRDVISIPHLIWPGRAAALEGKHSFGPNRVEVFASQACEVRWWAQLCEQLQQSSLFIGSMNNTANQKNVRQSLNVIYYETFTHVTHDWRSFREITLVKFVYGSSKMTGH